MSDRPLPSALTDGSHPVQVAVVEDDAAIRELVTTLLEDANITVEACPLGWEAHLCIRNNPPKVVILDIHMPSVDGIQLFYLLRADPQTKDIPVIFLTANPAKVPYEMPNYQAMGAVVLPKPFHADALLELVGMQLAA